MLERAAKRSANLEAMAHFRRGLQMIMWGDRLIDAARYDHGEWESSKNYTWPAIYMIPKDIVIADWHYEKRDAYPSLRLFRDKGFRVLPTSWKDVEASRALIEHAQSLDDPGILGHLFTSWTRLDAPAEWPPLVANAELARARPRAAPATGPVR